MMVIDLLRVELFHPLDLLYFHYLIDAPIEICPQTCLVRREVFAPMAVLIDNILFQYIKEIKSPASQRNCRAEVGVRVNFFT